MSDHKFNCPACGQKISCDSSAAGSALVCPTCQAAFQVPPAPAPAPGVPASRPAPKPAPVPLQSKAAALGVTIQTGNNYSRLAIASVISSFVFGIGWLPGLICGHLAKARIRRNPLLDGEKMANFGLVISYLWLLVIPIVSATFILNRPNLTPPAIVRDQPGAMADLARRKVDEVVFGDPQSVITHGLTGGAGVWQEQHWRSAQWGSTIRCTMKVLPDEPMILNCHFSDNPSERHFDVLVEGRQIGTEVFKFNVPGHFYDVEYRIPTGVTHGKNSVQVEFRAPLVMVEAKLYGCQILRRE